MTTALILLITQIGPASMTVALRGTFDEAALHIGSTLQNLGWFALSALLLVVIGSALAMNKED